MPSRPSKRRALSRYGRCALHRVWCGREVVLSVILPCYLLILNYLSIYTIN
jgi:hypothetical protein